MTKALISTFALAFMVAGCSSGAQDAGTVPTGPASSTAQATSATTTAPTPSTSTSASASAMARCEGRTAAVRLASQEGAAGTIRTLWRVKNTAQSSCRSFGYPGMDFRASSGWLNVQVHRGGFPDINQPPTRVVVLPGHSMYFVSYWNDAATSAGPCKDFDRVKVTLPDNFVSVKVNSTGCLNTGSVDVGPVTMTPPS